MAKRKNPHANRSRPESRCGSVPVSRYRTETLRQLGWQLCKTQTLVEWCRHAQEYVPWLEADEHWRMVPLLG
jgi:hypothetical protein